MKGGAALFGAAAIIAATAGPLAGATADAATAADGPTCPDIFTAAFEESIAADFPGHRFTAQVVDLSTGCVADLRPGVRLTTASAVKAEILGATLLAAQDAGRGLTATETRNAERMIRWSHNSPPTSSLWVAAGLNGLNRFSAAVGATATSHTPTYGLTLSTAADRNRVAIELLHDGSVLTDESRQTARRLMTSVEPIQQFGISAGLPAGWTVALKNGFFPARGLGWRVASTGVATGDDFASGYALSILTDGSATMAEGVALVEAISRQVAAELTVGPAAPRAAGRAVCVTADGRQSFAALATDLGLPVSAAPDLERVNGNEGPLSGQLVCAPDIPPPTPQGRVVTAAGPSDPLDLGGATPVGITAHPAGGGAWVTSDTGTVVATGTAGHHGDLNELALNQPIVGMAPTPTGNGYWLVASDGGIFAYGDATFHGSTGNIALNQPIVGMAPTPTGNGYWLVASDGGIFAYGDATFHGSTGNIALNQPIVGMAPTPTGNGYWLVASDGGIFAYGDAGFAGSAVGQLVAPTVGVHAYAGGYVIVAADGTLIAAGTDGAPEPAVPPDETQLVSADLVGDAVWALA